MPESNQQSVLDMAREEIAALRHMSYSGGIDGRPWRPDLEPADIGKIATLLAELVEQHRAALDELEKWSEWALTVDKDGGFYSPKTDELLEGRS